jgi:hypothetical protein
VLFKNGKIVEEWEIYDAMGMMAQLGASDNLALLIFLRIFEKC